jgi:hypothetical protein|tara:strand:+ start:51 stop:182 length:132 start_codon:yes stop_codon:yes gene_type:complete
MKIIETVEECLRAAGCPNINLQVRADNEAVTSYARAPVMLLKT